MANEERREETIIINGSNMYGDTIDIDECRDKTDAIYRLQFQMFQHLQHQIGLHPNMELALHIRINEMFSLETGKPKLYGRMETIPIYRTEYRVTGDIPVEPYIPKTRKCTIKERLKILFKGEL